MEHSKVTNKDIINVLDFIERDIQKIQETLNLFRTNFENDITRSSYQNTYLYNNLITYVYPTLTDIQNDIDYSITMGKPNSDTELEYDSAFYNDLNQHLINIDLKTENIVKEITPYILKKQIT